MGKFKLRVQTDAGTTEVQFVPQDEGMAQPQSLYLPAEQGAEFTNGALVTVGDSSHRERLIDAAKTASARRKTEEPVPGAHLTPAPAPPPPQGVDTQPGTVPGDPAADSTPDDSKADTTAGPTTDTVELAQPPVVAEPPVQGEAQPDTGAPVLRKATPKGGSRK
jgi:hypothetical protein